MLCYLPREETVFALSSLFIMISFKKKKSKEEYILGRVLLICRLDTFNDVSVSTLTLVYYIQSSSHLSCKAKALYFI